MKKSACEVRLQIGPQYTTGQVAQFVTESNDTGETVEEVCHHLQKHRLQVRSCTIEFDPRLSRKQAASSFERCRPIYDEINRKAG